MTSKKILVRDLLFTVIIMATGFCCTGCFTAVTLDELGSTRSYIAGEHYEYSPDRGEIDFSCRKEKDYFYIPFLHAFGAAPTKTVQTYEKQIPLNPVPDDLMRIELNVIPDASAARAVSSPSIGSGGGFRASDGIMEFPTPVTRIHREADPSGPQPILSAGDTLELRAHPDDLRLLSEPFAICLRAPFDQVIHEFYPEYRSVSGGPAEAESEDGHDGRELDVTVHLLVFPYAQDGSRCQALTAADLGFNNLHPFSRVYADEVKQDNEQSTGFFGWCWKILWVPAAFVTDVACTPFYLGYLLYCVCSGESVL